MNRWLQSITNHWLSMADPAWKIIPITVRDDFLGAGSRGVKVISPCGSEFEFCVSEIGNSSTFMAIPNEYVPRYLKGENKVASDLASEYLGLKRNKWWP